MSDAHTHRPKALILFHDFRSGGPVAVVDRLSGALKARGAEVVVSGNLQSMQWEMASDPRKAPILPKLFTPPAKQVKQLIDREKPDILIVEHFPFQDKNPLSTLMADAIRHARAVNPDVVTYGIPRDVPNFRHVARLSGKDPQASPEWASQMAGELVDHVLVRGDERVVDSRQYFTPEQQARFAHKLHHVGYTVPSPVVGAASSGGGVLVHLGGGPLANDLTLYRQLLQTIPHLHEGLQGMKWRFVITPDASKAEVKALEQVIRELPAPIRPHVSLELMHTDYLRQVQAADMVLVRGGISAVEAVSYGKPTVAFPASVEQITRCEGLQKATDRLAFLQDWESYHQAETPIDPAELKQTLEETLAWRRVKTPPIGVRIHGHEAMAQGMIDRYHGVESQFDGRAKA